MGKVLGGVVVGEVERGGAAVVAGPGGVARAGAGWLLSWSFAACLAFRSL